MNKKQPLTRQNARVLCFIEQYIANNKYPPTRAEIAQYLDCNTNGAQYHIDTLQKRGYIEVQPRKVRAIKILD